MLSQIVFYYSWLKEFPLAGVPLHRGRHGPCHCASDLVVCDTWEIAHGSCEEVRELASGTIPLTWTYFLAEQLCVMGAQTFVVAPTAMYVSHINISHTQYRVTL
jgi:hypothetical protein